MESAGAVGVHRYGYVTDEIDQVASEFKQKGAEILRENRDDTGKLTTIFVKVQTEWNWKSVHRASVFSSSRHRTRLRRRPNQAPRLPRVAFSRLGLVLGRLPKSTQCCLSIIQ